MASLHRRGDLVRDPRRADDPVLHLLFDVRVPADRRPDLGVRGPARARVHDRRHGRPDDAHRRGPPARRRAQPHPGLDRPGRPRLRPGLRLRAGRRWSATASAGCTTTARTSSTTSPSTTRTTRSRRSPTGVDEGIVRGIYRFDGGAGPGRREGPRAPRRLRARSCSRSSRPATCSPSEFGIAAEVYSATSFQQLRHEALQVERWNRLHPDKTPRVPYVSQVLGPDGGPIVVATDWVRTLPDLVAPWVPDPYIVLGTDGFGRSDTRESLRAHFEIDPPHIAAAALAGLARCGSIDARQAAKSIRALGRRSRDVRPADPLTRQRTRRRPGRDRPGVPERVPRGTAREVFAATLRLGLTSFGGPIAHLGYQRRAFVDERGWLDDAAFADLAALCQTLPGPGQQPADDRGRPPARGLGRRVRRVARVHAAQRADHDRARPGRGRRARAGDRRRRGCHPRASRSRRSRS